MRYTNALHLRQTLQHLIRGSNRLAVDFISALGLNHVDQFFHHVDVRCLCIVLNHDAGTVCAWRIGIRITGCTGFHVQVFALAFQTGRIDEGRQLQVTDFGRCHCARQFDRHDTVTTDSQTGRIDRDSDRRLNWKAARGNQLSLIVGLKRTVTGVCRSAIRQQDLKETCTIDRNVFGVACQLQITLCMNTLSRNRTYTGTQLQA